MRKGFVFVLILGMIAGIVLLLLLGAKIVFPELTISKETVSKKQVVDASKNLIQEAERKKKVLKQKLKNFKKESEND